MEVHDVGQLGAVFRWCYKVCDLAAQRPESTSDRQLAVRLELSHLEGLFAGGGKRAGLPVARATPWRSPA